MEYKGRSRLQGGKSPDPMDLRKPRGGLAKVWGPRQAPLPMYKDGIIEIIYIS